MGTNKFAAPTFFHQLMWYIYVMKKISLYQDISAFSHLRYFGVQREGQNGCIDEESQSFAKLRDIVKEELEDNSVRSARGMELIFKALCVSTIKRIRKFEFFTVY